MMLLRPVDPDKPITILNARAVELDEPHPDWLLEEIAYVIESTNVELPDG